MINFFLPILLIIFQGLFNAGETAVLSIEKSRLGLARREKRLWAIRTHNFLASPDRFFTTINVCDDLLLVIAATLFAQFFIIHFGNNAIILSTIILSLFSLIVGQYIPKSIALANPEKTMIFLNGPIFFFETLIFPIVYLFSKISREIAHLLGSRSKTDVIRHSDIIYAMSEYEKDASKLATRLFGFSKRTVTDVMIPLNAVFAVKQGNELEAISEGVERLYTRIPVCEDKKDNIVGIFNLKDYFYNDRLILRPPLFVNAKERCMKIFLTMKEKGEHMAIVRDDEKHVQGILTLEDLIEELVGEIRNEK